MILLDETIIGLWFVAMGDRDWMGAVNRLPDGQLQLTARFRYYETQGAWDGLDRKEWTQGVLRVENADRVCDLMRTLQQQFSKATGQPTYEVVRGERSLNEFMDEVMRMPFAHVKQGAEAEAELAKQGGKP